MLNNLLTNIHPSESKLLIRLSELVY